MRLCFIGDIVGSSGRRALKAVLPGFLSSNGIDVCVINAENSAHGLGCSDKICAELKSLGADVITLGNHTFSNYEFLGKIDKLDYVVKPCNVSKSWKGNDIVTVEKNGQKLAVINILGQINMMPSADNPFEAADELISEINDMGIRSILVDFHSETTSEKCAMGYYLAGKASVVVGTHTHVQTSDNRILDGGTGYITDVGMTGSVDSVLGMDIDTSIRRLKDKISVRYEPAMGPAMINGVIAEIDADGRCTSFKRFTEYE
ncbi:MAG: TIGR00282 family metallophosphoesterase [Clostridiales bacterium]|nr:TIGR00282 family metallophosphoesterase [Clostridiales bacterium]